MTQVQVQGFSPEVMAKREALDRVRRRVLAIGLMAVTLKLTVGLIIFARVLVDDPGKHGNAVGLLFMAGVVTALSYAAVRFILGGRLLSPWLVLTAAVPIAGAIWVL